MVAIAQGDDNNNTDSRVSLCMLGNVKCIFDTQTRWHVASQGATPDRMAPTACLGHVMAGAVYVRRSARKAQGAWLMIMIRPIWIVTAYDRYFGDAVHAQGGHHSRPGDANGLWRRRFVPSQCDHPESGLRSNCPQFVNNHFSTELRRKLDQVWQSQHSESTYKLGCRPVLRSKFSVSFCL